MEDDRLQINVPNGREDEDSRWELKSYVNLHLELPVLNLIHAYFERVIRENGIILHLREYQGDWVNVFLYWLLTGKSLQDIGNYFLFKKKKVFY